MQAKPNNASIKQWHASDRPREKAIQRGLDALSDSELLSILIATGTRERSALDLARDLLAMVDNNLDALAKKSIRDYCEVKGMGTAKAVIIAAALELGRRRSSMPSAMRAGFSSSRDAYLLLGPRIADLTYEEFWVLYLNKANRLIQAMPQFKGGMSAVVVDVKIIMRKALELGAQGLILAHNHPSEQARPSQADIELTRKVREACATFDMTLIDHIIIAGKQYYSFADEGCL